MWYDNPLFSVEVQSKPLETRKRPPNKYNEFFTLTMAALKVELPHLKHRERMALTAELWRIRKAETSCE